MTTQLLSNERSRPAQLGESHEDRTQMDNHLYRPEVQQALAEGLRLINPAAVRLLDTTEELALERSFAQVVRHYHLIELWKRCRQTGEEQIKVVELSLQRPFLQAIVTPLQDAEPRAYLLILQDLTRVRQLETVRRDFISNISQQRSKAVDELRDAEFDLIITVCDNAASNCPLWLGSGKVKHIGFPDPAAAIGSEAERLTAFRQVRDSLRQEVLHYLEEEMEDSAVKGGFYVTATGNL